MGNCLRTPADIEQEIRQAILEEELRHSELLRQYDLRFGAKDTNGYLIKVYRGGSYQGVVCFPYGQDLDFYQIVQKYLDEKKRAIEDLHGNDDD